MIDERATGTAATEEGDGLEPPEGFVRMRPSGPFTEHNGPYYGLQGAETTVHGLWVLPRHANRLGVVHGGMMATFLDTLLGQAVLAAAGKPIVTIHLSIDYLSMARVGEWLEGRATITRATRDVVFAEARAQVGGRDVARSSGVFKVMNGRP